MSPLTNYIAPPPPHSRYFQEMWNQLDFCLVISSCVGFLVDTVLSQSNLALNPSIFRIIRLARLTRALKAIRLMGRVKGIASLVETLVIAIPAMSNVASVCFLVMFIFSVMGMDFFGSDSLDQWNINGMYNDYANFRNFGDAFMLLFRAVTGESWNGVMQDMQVADCDPQISPLNDCGAPHPQAWMYFLAFNILVTSKFIIFFLI